MPSQAPSIEMKGFLSLLVLHELSRNDLAGDALAEKIGERKGTDTLTPGTIYPTLKRLRKLGFIKYKRFGRKKVYHLLPKGEQELTIMYNVMSSMMAGVKPRAKAKTKPKKKTAKTQKKKRSK
jgi:DNA-binding PadR family transcriptional regulator